MMKNPTVRALRRPPTITLNANHSYILLDVSAVVWVASLILGILIGVGAAYLHYSGQAEHVASVTAPKANVIAKKIIQPPQQPAVPAIEGAITTQTPASDASTNQPSTPVQAEAVNEKAKEEKQAQYLANKYQMQLGTVAGIIAMAKDAEARTNVPYTLTIAVAAKRSGLRMSNDGEGTLIGLMRINPKVHPDEVAYLKTQNMSADQAAGNLLLGAKLLSRRISEASGDVPNALQAFANAKDDKSREFSNAVLEIEKTLKEMS